MRIEMVNFKTTEKHLSVQGGLLHVLGDRHHENLYKNPETASSVATHMPATTEQPKLANHALKNNLIKKRFTALLSMQIFEN